MKLLHIYILLLTASISFSQNQGYTDFQSGTFEDWTNSDGSISNLTLEQPGVFDDLFYLNKICDGSNSINGEMAIKNPLWFQDDYVNCGGGIGGAGQIHMYIKNENTFDLYLRLGFTDLDGSKIVTTTPIIIPPSIGVWHDVQFINIWPSEFTLIEGPNSIYDVLCETFEMKLIHNENISFDGAYESGIFKIDNIGTAYLGINDIKNQSVEIYPIPTKNLLYIKTNDTAIQSVEIYDIIGRKKKVEFKNLYQVDLSNSSSGIYFLKIFTENGMVTKKIIKN